MPENQTQTLAYMHSLVRITELALWEAKVGRSPEVRDSRPTWRNPISTKNTKIIWVWWQVPVIPATREAEAGKWLEPRR
uniref:Uncharacterized protein n=1 Tax=Pan paniscus TaxID=9597 RepID=A0A2R9C006_PANPA